MRCPGDKAEEVVLSADCTKEAPAAWSRAAEHQVQVTSGGPAQVVAKVSLPSGLWTCTYCAAPRCCRCGSAAA